MTTETEELGIGAASAPELRTLRRTRYRFGWKPLDSAEALRRARSFLATPDQIMSTDETRRVLNGLVAGIDNDYLFPEPPDPSKRFTV